MFQNHPKTLPISHLRLDRTQAQFPKPVDYYFRPLDEHVNVYSGPFRIVQDVAIDGSRESEAALKDREALTIQATLDYQACDDKICLNPQSLPMSWTVNLKPLDRERPR